MDFERVITDEPIRHIWNRLDFLSTISGANSFLENKATKEGIKLNKSLQIQKAQGIAFSVRTAKDYFSHRAEKNLTATSLSYYYGAFSLLQALLLADIDNDLTLKTIEKYTASGGHGLKLVTVPGTNPYRNEILKNEYITVSNSGFFNHFLKAQKYDLEKIVVSRNIKFDKKDSTEDMGKIFTVMEIISRIPELKGLFVEIFREQPNYVSVIETQVGANWGLTFPLYKNTPYLTKEKIRDIFNWGPEIELEEHSSNKELRTKEIKEGNPFLEQNPFKVKNLHRSELTQDVFIRPLNTIEDKILFDFMFLYALSIWVRYRPALWREITEGVVDLYRPLITNFLIQIERVFPNIILNRLYNKQFIFSSHSYFS